MDIVCHLIKDLLFLLTQIWRIECLFLLQLVKLSLINYRTSWHHLRRLCNVCKVWASLVKYVLIIYFLWCPAQHTANLITPFTRMVKKKWNKPRACFLHSETFSFALELWCCWMEGLECGELQSCHLGITCCRNHRWRSSLHSTHGNAIHSTRQHAALEISFVVWSHWGLKKDQWGNLIQCGSGNCQWQGWEFAPVMN